MNKRPGLRKRLALELFRSIRKNRAKIHELRTLFWECTLRCNASCLHCGSDCHVSSAHPDMPVEDFLKVIDEITPHVDPHKVMITFTGGEALVRKDIEACGRELNKREYPWGIVSNGLLLNRTRLDSLLAAGMHSITISLDGFEEAHNWLRGNRRSFEGAVNAIAMLAEEAGRQRHRNCRSTTHNSLGSSNSSVIAAPRERYMLVLPVKVSSAITRGKYATRFFTAMLVSARHRY